VAIIGAAMSPPANATAAISFMRLSLGCRRSVVVIVDAFTTASGSQTMKWLGAAVAAAGIVMAFSLAPSANADVVAYLVNVHVRPGYNFPSAEAAIGYGQSICDRVAARMSYARLVDQVNADFNSADYYQGGYLINQAVNELCPAQIWQLRQSAAGYTVPA
jgi:hypothetical protein